MLQNHFIGNKASEINKIFFWYFYWNYVCFFASFAYWKFYKPESYCFKWNNRIWWLNGYDFLSYQTTFHKKIYHNRLSNSTTLFVVYKWPLRIETVVIKLNEIKVFEVLFSKFCTLLRKDIDESRLKLQRFSKVTLGTAFPAPLRYRVLLFRVQVFRFF